MGTGWLGLAILVLGALLALAAALADVLGVGQPGFGIRQTLGVLLGLVVMWLGYRWWRATASR